MLKEEHYCKNCGHRCHCYGPDCEKCYCDTCQCGRINNHLKVYFLFINQNYVNSFLKELVFINRKVFPENIEFLDYGFDESHGGIKTQKFISNKLFDFIKTDDEKN